MDDAVKLLALIPTLILAWIAWRRFRPDIHKLEADTAISVATLVRTLQTEVTELRDKCDATDRREREKDRKIASLEQTVAAMTAAIPELLLAAHLTDIESLKFIFDQANDGYTLTSSRTPGAFLWVNAYVARKLQRTSAEIVSLGYKRIVAGNHLDRTITVEGGAAMRNVNGFVNELLRADGKRVQCRWFSTKYRETDGTAFSLVIMRDVDDEVA